MQWTLDYSVAKRCALFLILGKKAKPNEATHTFTVWPGVHDRRAARRANSNLSLLRVNDVHDVKIWYI
jgi:hypothetical protein